MARFIISAFLFLFLFIVETSFFSSLPSILSFTPVVFGLSLYIIQRYGIFDGFAWIVVYGLMIDTLRLGNVPLVTIPCVCAAFVSYFTAKHLFSNRSFYGVIACALSSYLTFAASEAIIILLRSLSHDFLISWLAFFQTHLYRSIMLVVVICLLFIFTSHIKTILNTLAIKQRYF